MGSKKPYSVGYGKPPKTTRFKPGQSGNSKGRPKGAKGLATLLIKTINETVIVTENGKRRPISKLEATVKQLVNKAASGEYRSIQSLLALVQMLESHKEGAPVDPPLTESDHLVMASIVQRLQRKLEPL